MTERKQVEFLGSSLEDLRAFASEVRQRLGHQLDQVQLGLTPRQSKSVPGLGKGISGVYELREEQQGGWYRVAYVANRGDKIYVLHAFQKKTNSLSKPDQLIIVQRYKLIP